MTSTSCSRIGKTSSFSPDITKPFNRLSLSLFGALFLVAFSDSNADPLIADRTNDKAKKTDKKNDAGRLDDGAFNPERLAAEGLSEDVSIVDCTLSAGTVTTCYQVVTNGSTSGVTVGPFCPDNISVQDEEEVGVWVDGGTEVYDITGDFIVNLPNLYGDLNWQLYDEATGDVNVTSGAADCEAAANPNVADENQNQCIECLLEDVNGGIEQTILIPTTPVRLDASVQFPANAFTMGVALNSVPLSGPAGIDDILGNYVIAAFDDCGGHINPAEGYHYHGGTECNETGTQADGHAAMIGYAIDGYAIYGRLDAEGNESVDLDECLGHEDETRGYHYHAASLSANSIIGCFRGEASGELQMLDPPRG